MDQDIPENDPVRTLDTIIDRIKTCHFEHLYNTYGASPYHPRMMHKVIIYGYINNMYSCRKTPVVIIRTTTANGYESRSVRYRAQRMPAQGKLLQGYREQNGRSQPQPGRIQEKGKGKADIRQRNRIKGPEIH